MEVDKKDFEYAGIFARFLAFLLDLVLVILLCVSITFLIAVLSKDQLSKPHPMAFVALVFLLFLFVIPIIYFIYSAMSATQATAGQRIFKIYVATKDGKKVGFLKVGARLLLFSTHFLILFAPPYLYWTCLLPNIITITFSREKVAFYDFICGIRVLKGKIS